MRLEAAAIAGAGGLVAVLALGFPLGPGHRVRRLWRSLVAREARRAHAAGLARLGGAPLLAFEVAAGIGGAAGAWLLTGFPALALAGAALGAGGLLHLVGERQAALRRARQDAVLEAVRTLRRLLDTGAVGVPAALRTLAESGPPLLRSEFARVGGATGEPAQRRAWRAARAAVGEAAFDLLAVAIEVQRPTGGELGPLFTQLEASVAGLHDVEREAEALGVQARSAAALILALPLGFLCLMCAIGSSYLDPYRTAPGQVFLGACLAVMGGAYVWIRRWLELPTEPRLELRDG